MTGNTTEGEDKAGCGSSEHAHIDPATLDPTAKSQDQKQLSKAALCFEAGDYQGVRQLVRALTTSSDPQIAQAASDLKRRVSVDPVQIAVIVFCSAVFLAIVITYILR